MIPQLAILGAILLVLFAGATTTVVTTMFGGEGSGATNTDPRAQSANTTTPIPGGSDVTNPFAGLAISGEAAYVWDIKGQRVLFKKNETEVLPLASITKLMTTLVAHELLAENDTVTITDAALRQDGDSGFLANETFTRRDISDLSLLSSSNDGAYALAASAGAALSNSSPASAFVTAMNIRAKEIGLTDTYFKNPTGLDISANEGGAYGTAKDVAFLMEYIVQNEPDLLAITKETTTRVLSEDGFAHDANNTNYYIDELPGLIGSKTGYTTLAGGNLVVAFNAGLDRPVVVVVLGSSRQARFTDVVSLTEAAQAFVSAQQ